MEELIPKIIAGLCCLGMWLPMAALGGFGAHRRMVSVESKDGTPAAPPHETPLLLYAVAATAWPFAFILACIGLAWRKWARVGRGATFILLAHFTVAVLGSVGLVMTESRRGPEVSAIVAYACAMVVFGALLAMVLTWRWTGARATRLAAGAPTGESFGLPLRFGVYAIAMAVPIAGLLMPFLMTEPQHAHVAKVGARLSLLGLMLIVLAVCAGVIALALLTPTNL